MENISFSPTEFSHLGILKKIYLYYIKNTTATFHIGDISDGEMYDILFPTNLLYGSFVIKDNTSVIGYVLLVPYKNRQAYFRSAEVTIYLTPEYSGKGIGEKAINFIESIALERDFKTLLSVICGENTASMKLFEKCGYNKCGHMKNVAEKFHRLLDIVIYEKEI